MNLAAAAAAAAHELAEAAAAMTPGRGHTRVAFELDPSTPGEFSLL